MTTRRAVLATGVSALAAPALSAPAEGYPAALGRAYGGTVDPAQAVSRFLEAADAARTRADALLRGQGLVAGEVAERLRTLARDPRWRYPDDGTGRDHAVAAMNLRLSGLRPALAAAFGDLPIAPAQVRRMTPAEEAAGKGGYRVAPQGGGPGVYYVDLHAIRARPAWTLPSVAFHEVTPGHLLQMSLAARAKAADGAASAGVYFEAWAIYAEQLAADLGAYRADPLGEIGYLQWRLFRLARGVADVGLNAQGWNRAKAIAQMRAMQGFPTAFVTIEADVDRIATNPGKVAAEALGALDLAAWRPRDRARWPGYHRTVLTGGPAPFGELRLAWPPSPALWRRHAVVQVGRNTSRAAGAEPSARAAT